MGLAAEFSVSLIDANANYSYKIKFLVFYRFRKQYTDKNYISQIDDGNCRRLLNYFSSVSYIEKIFPLVQGDFRKFLYFLKITPLWGPHNLISDIINHIIVMYHIKVFLVTLRSYNTYKNVQ